MSAHAFKPSNTNFGTFVEFFVEGFDISIKQVLDSGFVNVLTVPLHDLEKTVRMFRNVNDQIETKGFSHKFYDGVDLDDAYTIECNGDDGFVEILGLEWDAEDECGEEVGQLTIADEDFPKFLKGLEGFISDLKK